MMMAVKNPECPICGDTFKDGRGLSGHLQFKHSLSGNEHKEKMDEGMDRGEKSQTRASGDVGGKAGRSIRDRELELKGMLHEIEEEIEGLHSTHIFPAWGESGEQMKELKKRKKEIQGELKKLDAPGGGSQ